MTRTRTLARMLAAALAITAIAIPAAAAKPVDLRSPDAQDAASSVPPNARGTDVAAPDQQVPTSLAHQDRRSPDTADLTPTVRPVPGPPTWPLNPEPLTPVSAQAIEDDGSPWLTVGFIAGAVLALGGTAALAGRIRRRRHRAGVPA
jgi:hypothetical protein